MKWIVAMAVAILFAGCVTPQLSGISSAAVGDVRLATMGDVVYGFAISRYAGGTPVDRWELTYTGMTGDVIKLQYKEYTKTYNGWMVKDAFNQLLEYDLSKSKVLAFRGFSCEVVEANGPQMKYKVLTVSDIK